ncbi:hypothetical protein [Microbacterium sp. CJ77]|uniref:hypothetical protein n=1 Tax=Microbacterium sp. CJ77 TaxID=2079201 RepID=UPI000CD8192F|nr:hypothetical protein [Microbacterium sp. CJ77]
MFWRTYGTVVGWMLGAGVVAGGLLLLAVWVLFGLASSGPAGLPVWAGIGAACALFAMLIAAPLTARAARRADNHRSGAPTGWAVSSL